MPELPDVETMRRLVDARALRRRIAEVDARDPRVVSGLAPTALADAVEGRRFVSAMRHGKWLFVEVERGPWLVMHFGMTGALATTGRGEADPALARVTFRFADGGALHFRDQRRFGRVGLTPSPSAFAAEKRLGPDALDPALTVAAFSERLADKRGPLKGVLLDQRFVAGIGNIYGDEVCFAARLGPFSRVERLTAEDRARVYRAMRAVLRAAVEREAGAKGFPRGWLIERRHADGVCPGSGEPVARRRFQGRYTYWCESRQPER